jgi:hypothetical protein
LEVRNKGERLEELFFLQILKIRLRKGLFYLG